MSTLFGIDAVISVAVTVHGGVFVEADGFETFGCVAEFFMSGWGFSWWLDYVWLID